MPNRYYNDFNGKLTAPTPPKERSGTQPSYGKDSTRAWPGAPGPVGSSRNKVGFPEVKQAQKMEMADDDGKFYMQGKKIKNPMTGRDLTPVEMPQINTKPVNDKMMMEPKTDQDIAKDIRKKLELD